jgi:hypothetical protein
MKMRDISAGEFAIMAQKPEWCEGAHIDFALPTSLKRP